MAKIPSKESVEYLKAEKVLEWRRRGYPEQIIRAGLNYAENWARRCGVKYGVNPGNAEEIRLKMLPEGLQLAENYMDAMMK